MLAQLVRYLCSRPIDIGRLFADLGADARILDDPEARRLTGTAISPLAVRFSAEAPADDAEYRRVFGCPVSFGCKANSMDLPRDIVDIPVLAPDPAMAGRFQAWAEECLNELSALRLTGRLVAGHILAHLDDGSLSIRTVARDLGMSSRSLQQVLAAEGSDFSQILRQTRADLARRYLKENRTVEEITCLLGFAEPSVFRKAFKKCSGLTPAEFRRSG